MVVSVACKVCLGKGYFMIGPECSNPASECCGGCYREVNCDCCNGKGSVDMFNVPRDTPSDVLSVLSTIDNNDVDNDLDRVQEEIEKLGYTFDFTTYAMPFNLILLENEEDIQSQVSPR